MCLLRAEPRGLSVNAMFLGMFNSSVHRPGKNGRQPTLWLSGYSFRSLTSKGYPNGYSNACVCLPALRKLRTYDAVLSKRRLTNTPRCHRLADGQLSSLCRPSPSFSSFGAASAMLCCCAPPACSGTPSRPSEYYPSP